METKWWSHDEETVYGADDAYGLSSAAMSCMPIETVQPFCVAVDTSWIDGSLDVAAAIAAGACVCADTWDLAVRPAFAAAARVG